MALTTWTVGLLLLYACYPLTTYIQCDLALEKPRYVIDKHLSRGVEVRKYDPFVIAATKVPKGTMKERLSFGFREIAGFIFGKNSKRGAAADQSESISMTAPVRYETSSGGGGELSFVMPSKYTVKTLPIPKSKNVQLKNVPSRTLAALRFSGPSPTDEEMKERVKELEDVLLEHGFEPSGAAELHQYHPPFAPSWMRRNEVLLPFRTKNKWLDCNFPLKLPLIWDNSV